MAHDPCNTRLLIKRDYLRIRPFSSTPSMSLSNICLAKKIDCDDHLSQKNLELTDHLFFHGAALIGQKVLYFLICSIFPRVDCYFYLFSLQLIVILEHDLNHLSISLGEVLENGLNFLYQCHKK